MSLDPACHAECLEFIRVAIAEAFRTTAHEIAAVLKEVCTESHADRAQIWSALEPIKRQQFQELLAPPPITRDDRQAYQGGDQLPVTGRGLRHRERVERGVRRWLFLQQPMFMRLLAKPNLPGSCGLPNEPGVRLERSHHHKN